MSDKNLVADIFCQGGILDKAIPSYEERAGQIAMAELSFDAFNDSSSLIVEAGTGIGKSFAYLAPAIFSSALGDGGRTVVATGTKALQKQLFEKDIPFLLKALGLEKHVTFSILMGRGNYLCRRRFYECGNFATLLSSIEDSPEAKFYAWVETTGSGIIDEYPGFPKEMPEGIGLSDICSDSEQCLSQKCPFFNKCFYQKAKRGAERADIVVTNHHLLFFDAMVRSENGEDYGESALLPPFDSLIIDECHNIDKNATGAFSQVFSEADATFVLHRLFEKKRGIEGNALIEDIASIAAMDDEIERMKDYKVLILNHMKTVNSFLIATLSGRGEAVIQKENVPFIINKCHEAELLLEELKTLVSDGRKILKRLEDDSEDSKVMSFSSIIHSLEAMALTLEEFLTPESWKDEVHYVSSFKRRGYEYAEITISPLEVGEILKKSLFDKVGTVICCSATLKVDDGFEYFKRTVGLDRGDLKAASFQSPFDFKRNLLLLPSTLCVKYRNGAEDEYENSIAPRIQGAIESSGGGALVLFTSKRMMVSVYEKLKDKLSYRLLLQSGGASPMALLNEFKEDSDSVLFGTQTFWEGVDVPGEALRLLIITKLPFPNPKDPILGARCKKLEKGGESPYMKIMVPEMVMKLKQGIGRVLRSSNDKGVVYILDNRFSSFLPYYLRQLPEASVPEEGNDDAYPRLIEDFLY